MSVTRRKLLHSIALTGAGTLVPRFAFPQQPGPGPDGGFPPQAQIDADPLRPRYHLAPVRGWMNDPCAPVYFNERYHMFFQNNPNASIWSNMNWAHAVSKDMVHWTRHPLALSPTTGGPDAFGVFTGTMIVDKAGVPTILYTCVSPSSKEQSTLWGSNPPEREAQCIALPQGVTNAHPSGNADTTLDTWNKNPTPVIPAPPEGMKVTGFRDPVPWREDDGSYYMLLASGKKGVGGNVLLYKSPDLHGWQYQGIFAQGKATGKQTDDTVDSGETWECPDFFPLGGKHVLIHSTGTPTGRKTLWQSGTLDKTTMKWTMEKEGVLNHGPYYAPKTQLDAHGNRILWGWIEETWPQEKMIEHGWSGCMSLPRIMTLDANGEARFTPAPACDSLRKGPLASTSDTQLQTEIVFSIEPRSSGPRGTQLPPTTPSIRIASHEDPSIRTVLFNGESIDLPENMPATFPVRCFVDHSLVELFIGNVIVLTRRVYDGTPTSLTLPQTMQATAVKAYALQSI